MQTELTTKMGVSGSGLKAWLGLLLLLLSSHLLLGSSTVTLVWRGNTEPDLAGYNIYFGPTNATYTNKITVGKLTTNTLAGLVSGAKYFFAVTAFNTSGGESDFSNEISYSVPPPTSLDIWKSTNFLAGELSDPAKEGSVWGDKADPDNDGRDNLMEFALGLDPNKSDAASAGIAIGMVDINGSKYATITFRRRKAEPLLQYLPEVSADGQSWNSGSGFLSQLSATSLDATFESAVFQDLTQVNPASPRFIRLRVAK